MRIPTSSGRNMRSVKNRFFKLGAIGAVAGAVALAIPGSASATTLTGWVGTTLPANGTIFLTSSSVTDSSGISAETSVYTAFGSSVSSGAMGVQPRLFKSGVLCSINDFSYNSNFASRYSDQTAGDCGEGWYNSHGFVRVWNGSIYVDYPTFPTDSLQLVASTPSAFSAPDASANSAISVNDSGETLGSALGANTVEELPDLILSYGTEGQVGYVAAADLYPTHETRSIETSNSDVPAPRNIPLFDADGETVVGEFRIGSM